MKIHPPKVTIDSNDPFKEALFARKNFAESLTGLLRNVNENLVIFVNAPWGEGKTTFARMWQASLWQQKFEVIYFDAYAADYCDDPFVSFSGEILALVEKHFPDTKGLAERREFKKTAVEVGKRLAGLAFKVGVRAATMGAVEVAHLTELKDIGSELSANVSEIGAEIIEKKIENHTAEKDALAAFKRSLTKLAAVVREEQGFPLTILVDELDRCRPDFALGLLERIKHLFDVEGVTFVLFVNRDQIESYIRALYGNEVDSAAYLLKFGNLFVDLPNEQPVFRHEKGRQEYCRELFQHFGFSTTKDGSTVSRSVETLVDHFGLTLRESSEPLQSWHSTTVPCQTNSLLIRFWCQCCRC
jgi:predicted KAP-like P-loop ATPase